MDRPAEATPIVCDMTDAPDTGPERIAAYKRLFADALIDRQHTVEGIRFRFRADDGVEDQVRDLAAREKACCAFFTFTVTRAGGEVLMDATVVDDDAARAVLEEFYALPDMLDEDPQTRQDRFTRHGLRLLPADPG